GLRDATERRDALLIFDEVITGFRVARGGASKRYGVTPDLTVLGKIIGGGLPVGAYGGRAALMKMIAPDGPVYQAGTLSGNPIAMAAGAATLRELTAESYEQLEEAGARLEAGLTDAANAAGASVQVSRVGSLLTAFVDEFPTFFHAMLAAGIMLPPSQHEAWFVSTAHRDADLDATLLAARDAFAVAGRER
nr:aminotransferase class III-fold pyridoxal phosphate-dependent enzyme [Gemmatimonadales bacterium]